MKTRLVASMILCLVASSAIATGAEAKKPAPADASLRGKVLPLAAILAKHDAKPDDDAGDALALVADDGRVYLLIKDDGSRLFFKDKRLHNRPVQLTGRIVPGAQMLQIKRVQTVVKDKLLEVIYWCDRCVLRYSEPGKCICCGAIVELLEVSASDAKLKSPALFPLDP